MSFRSMQAFIGLPLYHGAAKPRYLRASSTPRRSRGYPVSLRSLDSYREGNRFGDDSSKRRPRKSPAVPSRNSERKEVRPPRPPKLRTPLVSALCKLNVASLETCTFLVRSGCVRVNGEVVLDQKSKIHRFDDELTVNGKSYGTLSSTDNDESVSNFSDYADVIDPKILPRGQRDFRKNPRQRPGPETYKKYNRSVDRGFFSSRRYHSGK